MILYGKSDVGMRRSVNQDNFYTEIYSDYVALCVVCDGMGGAKGGSEASAIAIEVFSTHMKEFIEKNLDAEGRLKVSAFGKNAVTSQLVAAATEANAAVFKKSNEEVSLSGMGTTLVAAVITDRTLYTANIGDSRLYHLSEDSVRQITHDHSFVQYLIDLGQITPEEAKTSSKRSMITRCVGTDDFVLTDTFIDTLKENDYVLLCSDGLINHVESDQLLSIVSQKLQNEVSQEDEVRIKVETLIEKANELGGTDNITAVLVKFQ